MPLQAPQISDRDKARADDFLCVFESQLLRKVQQSKSVLEIDRAIQAFATAYAKGTCWSVEKDEKNSHTDYISNYTAASLSEVCFLNADAVYLTSFALLDLRYRMALITSEKHTGSLQLPTQVTCL